MDISCLFFFFLYILPHVPYIWNYIAFLVFLSPTIGFCFHILLLHDKSSKNLAVYKTSTYLLKILQFWGNLLESGCLNFMWHQLGLLTWVYSASSSAEIEVSKISISSSGLLSKYSLMIWHSQPEIYNDIRIGQQDANTHFPCGYTSLGKLL